MKYAGQSKERETHTRTYYTEETNPEQTNKQTRTRRKTNVCVFCIDYCTCTPMSGAVREGCAYNSQSAPLE